MFIGGVMMIEVMVHLAVRKAEFWQDLFKNASFVHQSQDFFCGVIFQNGKQEISNLRGLHELRVNEFFVQSHLPAELVIRHDLMFSAKFQRRQ